MRKILLCLLGCSLAISASAKHLTTDLLSVYQMAKHNDPNYLAQVQQWYADKEALPQGVALQLPTLSASYSTTGNYRRFKHGFPTPQPPERYNSQNFSLSLSEPIINFANWETLRQASNQVKAATARVLDAEQSLMVTTARAYLSVLLAKDVLRYDLAEQRATVSQLAEARRRHDVGLVAITSVHQAKSSYQKVASQVVGSQMSLENARRDLERLTGRYYIHLAPLQRRIPLVYPVPYNIQSWIDAAVSHNYALEASRYDMYAARATVGINFSGHLPTVNLVANASRDFNNGTTAPGSSNDFRSDTINRSLGLQVSLPLFQGGAVLSRTRQAQHEYLRSAELVRVNLRNALMLVHQNFSNIMKGITKLKIDRRTVATSFASLKSTREAYDVGTSSFIDVLVVQRDLFQAQKVYATDEFNYIMAILEMKKAAGTLCLDDLRAINNWLVKH